MGNRFNTNRFHMNLLAASRGRRGGLPTHRESIRDEREAMLARLPGARF